MKLVRFGESGLEQPGLIDASGALRDLSSHIADLSGQSLGPEVLKRLRSLVGEELPWSQAARALAPAWGRWASSCASVSTTSTTCVNPGQRCPPSRFSL